MIRLGKFVVSTVAVEAKRAPPSMTAFKHSFLPF